MRCPPKFLLCLLLLGLGTTIASAIEDGLYNVPRIRIPDPAGKGYIFRDATGLKEITDKGIELKKYSVAPDASSIVSQSNDNSDYKLWVDWINTPMPASLALILDGNYVPFTYACGNSIHFDYTVHLTDPKLVARAAALFHITPYSRHHPGHQFTCKFIPNPKGYTLSGPFPVTFQITNCGTTPFRFCQSGGVQSDDATMGDFLFDPFSFTALFHPTDNIGGDNTVQPKRGEDDFAKVASALQPDDSAPAEVILHPGESFTAQVDLGQYLKVKKVGTYEVRGTFHFQLLDLDYGKTENKNVPWHILWDEFATAAFETQIASDKTDPATKTDPQKQ